jgi:lysine 2,3-aminomutase
MLKKVSDHIKQLAEREPAIARQFIASEQESEHCADEALDPLQEDQYEVVKGLIHKYGNRVLCLLTMECAAYCRFCTRRRVVSDIERGRIGIGDIERWAGYLSAHPEVKEVIISGGDPFTVSDELLGYTLERLTSIPTIKVLRIGTRVPVSSPDLITDAKLDAIRSINQPVYVGIHFEHPAELTDVTIEAIEKLRKAGTILYSQTVFLVGVNDSYEILYKLFSRLIELGVRPYYIYRCDPVVGAGHFRVDIEKERAIMTSLRRDLSGLACPTYVIDTPQGSGKIPVPLDFWDADISTYRDFYCDEHRVEDLRTQSCEC